MTEYIIIGLIVIIGILFFNSLKSPTTIIHNSFPCGDDENNNSNLPKITQDFKNGINYAWSVMQVCLYKMYKENDILDFDNIFQDILKNINTLSNNNDEMKKWNIEYIKYIEEKNKDGGGK